MRENSEIIGSEIGSENTHVDKLARRLKLQTDLAEEMGMDETEWVLQYSTPFGKMLDENPDLVERLQTDYGKPEFLDEVLQKLRERTEH